MNNKVVKKLRSVNRKVLVKAYWTNRPKYIPSFVWSWFFYRMFPQLNK